MTTSRRALILIALLVIALTIGFAVTLPSRQLSQRMSLEFNATMTALDCEVNLAECLDYQFNATTTAIHCEYYPDDC